jgi:urease accessory protein
MKIFQLTRKILPALAAAVVLGTLGAATAHAHVLSATAASWLGSLAHPFTGLDHVLAMVAVGLWAARLERRAAWLLPLAFPLLMAGGAVLAASGLTVPGVAAATASSVMVLGLLVAVAARPSVAVAAAVVGFFALFHGHAHGTELAMTAAPWLHGAGLLIATALLHGIGLALGSAAGPPMVRVAGAAVSSAGFVILAGAWI